MEYGVRIDSRVLSNGTCNDPTKQIFRSILDLEAILVFYRYAWKEAGFKSDWLIGTNPSSDWDTKQSAALQILYYWQLIVTSTIYVRTHSSNTVLCWTTVLGMLPVTTGCTTIWDAWPSCTLHPWYGAYLNSPRRQSPCKRTVVVDLVLNLSRLGESGKPRRRGTPAFSFPGTVVERHRPRKTPDLVHRTGTQHLLSESHGALLNLPALSSLSILIYPRTSISPYVQWNPTTAILSDFDLHRRTCSRQKAPSPIASKQPDCSKSVCNTGPSSWIPTGVCRCSLRGNMYQIPRLRLNKHQARCRRLELFAGPVLVGVSLLHTDVWYCVIWRTSLPRDIWKQKGSRES